MFHSCSAWILVLLAVAFREPWLTEMSLVDCRECTAAKMSPHSKRVFQRSKMKTAEERPKSAEETGSQHHIEIWQVEVRFAEEMTPSTAMTSCSPKKFLEKRWTPSTTRSFSISRRGLQRRWTPNAKRSFDISMRGQKTRWPPRTTSSFDIPKSQKL